MTSSFLKLALAVAVPMICFISDSNAQLRRDEKAISYVRAYTVSKIDRDVPKGRFDTWLRKTAGRKAKITWEVNDCGEQTGTPADRGRDFPMCVEANVQSGDIAMLVSLMVGTFKKGISGKPRVRHIEFHLAGEEHIDLNKLSELSAAMRKLIQD